MPSHQLEIVLSTPGRGLLEVTDQVRAAVARAAVHTGLCVVFCRHTSASLVVQENADPSAARDLEAAFDRLAPDGDPHHTHTAEGPDDMPAHVRAALTRTTETIPIVAGELALGTWQGLFLFEHRLAPHSRRLLLHITGE